MSDPGKSTAAEIRYQVQIQLGPLAFSIRGVRHEIKFGQDVVVIVRQVLSRGGIRMGETIVGVIGDEYESSYTEFLRIRNFMNTGGIIGLARDLVD